MKNIIQKINIQNKDIPYFYNENNIYREGYNKAKEDILKSLDCKVIATLEKKALAYDEIKENIITKIN